MAMREEIAISAPLTEAEQLKLQEELWRLLANRASRLTMGESTSLPAERAGELLESLCATLNLSPDRPDRTRGLLAEGLETACCRGEQRLRVEVRRGEQLWRAACLTAPAAESIALRDTLRSLGGFWKQYDVLYAAHQVPCDIDYQLFQPVPENLRGVYYVNEYLRRLLIENRFLSRLNGAGIMRVLTAVSPGYRTLVMNLLEPPAACALGLALLGKDPAGLEMDGEIRSRLADLLEPMTAAERRQALERGCGALCDALQAEPAERRYVGGLAAALAPRLDAALTAGELSGLFPG